MSRRRLALVLIGVLLIVAASVSAVIGFYATRLPAPEVADRQALLRWLITRDLSAEDPALVRTLARRLEEEFGRETVDWQATRGHLDPSMKGRMLTNICALIGPWFDGKVEQYFGLPQAERAAYLDHTIDAIGQWRDARSMCEEESGTSTSGLLSALFQQINEWKRQLEPQRRKQCGEFLAALQLRWLQRTFLGDWPARAKRQADHG